MRRGYSLRGIGMPEADKFLKVFAVVLYATALTVGAFMGSLWGALGIAGGVILYFGAALSDKNLPMPPKKLGLFALLVLAALALEIPFSSAMGKSPSVWLNLATTFIPLVLLLSPRLRILAYSPLFLPVAAGGLAAGAAALGFEYFFGGVLLSAIKGNAPLSVYNRGMAHIVILGFPLLGGVWAGYGKRYAFGLALALVFPLFQTCSQTSLLAFLTGCAITALALRSPAIARNALGVGICAVSLWPFYAQLLFARAFSLVERLPDSFRQRAEIWDFLSYRILERPLLGWGLGSTAALDFTKPHGDLYLLTTSPAPHAHNFIVQTWVETGIPGLAICLFFLLMLVQMAAALRPSLRPFAFGGLAASIVICLFGFNFWTDALWSAFALSAFVFGILQQNGERKKHLVDA